MPGGDGRGPYGTFINCTDPATALRRRVRLRHTLLRKPQHIKGTTATSPGATLTMGTVAPDADAVVLVTFEVLKDVEAKEDAERVDGRNIPFSTGRRPAQIVETS